MSNRYPTLNSTVDVVLLTLLDGALHVALFPREREPFKGVLALPGGYVHPQEDRDLVDAANRILKAKTGLEGLYLEQLQTFGGLARDPRGWSLSVVYLALVAKDPLSAHAAAAMQLVPVTDLRGLPFDHKDMVVSAVERLRTKGHFSSQPALLCPAPFSISALKAVYEQVCDTGIPEVTFRRKVQELGMLEEVVAPPSEVKLAHRAPATYRLKPEFHHQLAVTMRGFSRD